MKSTEDRLYHLLPTLYRQQDAKNGQALRALLRVMEREFRNVEADIETLYDNWFVETCQEWVLPYIGEVLGIRDLVDEKSVIASQRRRIANTIRYRRRKGTSAVLENVVFDVTGWPTRLVEFFDHISVTQSVSNIRVNRGRVLDIRDSVAMDQLDGPFDSHAHLVDVRSIGSDTNRSQGNRGKYGIPNVGLFICRLQSYAAIGRTAIRSSRKLSGFHFNSMGLDFPLFNRPAANRDLSSVSDLCDLPVALTRNLLRRDLNQYKKTIAQAIGLERPISSLYYGPGRALNISVNGSVLTPDQIISCDLTNWHDDSLEQPDFIVGQELWARVGVDVELGRLMFSDSFLRQNDAENLHVMVDFNYGFSADMGGGQYDRSQTLTDLAGVTWSINMAVGTEIDSLPKALGLWSEHCRATAGTQAIGVIRILDDAIYDGNVSVVLPRGSHLVIEAVDGKNPCFCLSEDLVVSGPDQDEAEVSLLLSGIGLNRTIRIAGGCVNLALRHCTIMPVGQSDSSNAAIVAEASARDVMITISHSILGPVHVPADKAISLVISDSIIDQRGSHVAVGAGDGPAGWGPPAVLERVTVFGPVRVRELVASESILSGLTTVERRQIGYARFSYAAPASLLPVTHRCQPEGEETSNARPHFTSVKYGTPGYAQLSHICPDAIRRGAKDGSEMGAFQSLRQSQREEGLKSVIHEYLRQDMEAGIFYVT